MKDHLSWSIIKLFSGRNTFGFTFQDVYNEFPKMKRVQLAWSLEDMVRTGMLGKIARNKYYLIPYGEDPVSYVPDWRQRVIYMMLNKEYFIAYASALKLHGIIPHCTSREPELTEYVITKQQIKPAIRSLRGITYQFIKQCEDRYFGFNNLWINQHEQVVASDLERTIVDISAKPQFCGGIVEVAHAILMAHARMDREKLYYYFARYMNQSAIKRFLFIIDILNLEWTSEHENLKEILGSGISILDPTVTKQGRKRRKFGLQINVDPLLIRQEVQH